MPAFDVSRGCVCTHGLAGWLAGWLAGRLAAQLGTLLGARLRARLGALFGASVRVSGAAEVQAKYKEREWNTMEIAANGDQLVQKINGVHFATLIDRDAEMSRAKGLIAFQDHGKGCTVAFRNVRLREAPAK